MRGNGGPHCPPFADSARVEPAAWGTCALWGRDGRAARPMHCPRFADSASLREGFLAHRAHPCATFHSQWASSTRYRPQHVNQWTHQAPPPPSRCQPLLKATLPAQGAVLDSGPPRCADATAGQGGGAPCGLQPNCKGLLPKLTGVGGRRFIPCAHCFGGDPPPGAPQFNRSLPFRKPGRPRHPPLPRRPQWHIKAKAPGPRAYFTPARGGDRRALMDTATTVGGHCPRKMTKECHVSSTVRDSRTVAGLRDRHAMVHNHQRLPALGPPPAPPSPTYCRTIRR